MHTPPVVIVGAGPVGLTLALALAAGEVPSIVLTAGSARCEGSRAIALHRSALAYWRTINPAITDAILSRAIAWRIRRTYYRERELHALELPPPDAEGLSEWCNYPQSELEALLLEAVDAAGGLIDLCWNHEVTGIGQDCNGVVAEVHSGEGLASFWPAPYVVACDGAKSTIRKLLRLEFPGTTYHDQFLITDIHADVDWPAEPRFFFDHPAHRESTLLIHPQPRGVWRVDWQLGRSVDAAAVPLLALVKLDQLLGTARYEVAWSSCYRFHQRLMRSLQAGRIFFAGDAAHLVAPFGARGLNSGIADVAALAPRLICAVRRTMAPEVLNSYDVVRRPALLRDQREVTATMRFMAPQTSAQRLQRDTILRIAQRCQFARPWINSGRMYRAS